MTRVEHAAWVRQALNEVVPGADPDALPPGTSLRDAFELDSLDFLAFVERLSAAAACTFPEDDHAELATYQGCLDLLARRAPDGPPPVAAPDAQPRS